MGEKRGLTRTIRQVARGCGDLPHVGPHPGWLVLGIYTGIAALGGVLNDGIAGAIVGAVVMLCGLGPFVLAGAYSRANLSDKLSTLEPSNG